VTQRVYQTAVDEAEEWLTKQLAKGPQRVQVLHQRLPPWLSWGSVTRAKQRMGVVSRRGRKGKAAPWYWLPPSYREHPEWWEILNA